MEEIPDNFKVQIGKYDDWAFPCCKLTVYNGKVLKQPNGQIFGKWVWHDFVSDTMGWPAFGSTDWTDFTWVFESAKFTAPQYLSNNSIKSLIEILQNPEYEKYINVSKNELAFSAKPGYVISWEKFPNMCGNIIMIVKKK